MSAVAGTKRSLDPRTGWRRATGLWLLFAALGTAPGYGVAAAQAPADAVPDAPSSEDSAAPADAVPDAPSSQDSAAPATAQTPTDVWSQDAALHRGIYTRTGRTQPAGSVVLQHGPFPAALDVVVGATAWLQLQAGGRLPLGQPGVSAGAAATVGLTERVSVSGRLDWYRASPSAQGRPVGTLGAAGQLCFVTGCHLSTSGAATFEHGRTTAFRLSNLWRFGFAGSAFAMLLEPGLWIPLDKTHDPVSSAVFGLRWAEPYGTVDVRLLSLSPGGFHPSGFATLTIRLH